MPRINEENMIKILFIDDDTMTLRLMKKEAEILGHDPILCPDSSDVIQYIDNSNPDLIMVDINMQAKNGFQVVREIRNHDRSGSIPVLMLSAGDPDTEEKKAIDAGANGFLMKPLTLNGMESAVKGFINSGQRMSVNACC